MAGEYVRLALLIGAKHSLRLGLKENLILFLPAGII